MCVGVVRRNPAKPAVEPRCGQEPCTEVFFIMGQVGDIFPMRPRDDDTFVVRMVEPERALEATA
jgi:hypothetical protein